MRFFIDMIVWSIDDGILCKAIALRPKIRSKEIKRFFKPGVKK
jgi:hypothetical protein